MDDKTVGMSINEFSLRSGESFIHIYKLDSPTNLYTCKIYIARTLQYIIIISYCNWDIFICVSENWSACSPDGLSVNISLQEVKCSSVIYNLSSLVLSKVMKLT